MSKVSSGLTLVAENAMNVVLLSEWRQHFTYDDKRWQRRLQTFSEIRAEAHLP